MRPYFCLPILACFFAAQAADAQVLLRWKLQAGEEFVVRTEQETAAHVAFSGKSARSKIVMQLDIRWQVQPASDASFTVLQTIERLTASLTTADGAAEFDSSAKSRSVGLAKQLSDALEPLIGAEIEVQLNDRGEVLAVKAANSAAAGLFKSAQDASEGAAAKAHSAVQQVVSQSILQLPAAEVQQGDEWQAVRELTTPAGKLRQETTYKLAEVADENGMRTFRIEFQATLARPEMETGASAATKTPVVLKDHQQSGVIFFSLEQGRVIASEQTQRLVTERPYRDTTIIVTLESTQKVTVESQEASGKRKPKGSETP